MNKRLKRNSVSPEKEIKRKILVPNKSILANIISDQIKNNKKADEEEVNKANVNFKKLDNTDRKVIF